MDRVYVYKTEDGSLFENKIQALRHSAICQLKPLGFNFASACLIVDHAADLYDILSDLRFEQKYAAEAGPALTPAPTPVPSVSPEDLVSPPQSETL